MQDIFKAVEVNSEFLVKAICDNLDKFAILGKYIYLEAIIFVVSLPRYFMIQATTLFS